MLKRNDDATLKQVVRGRYLEGDAAASFDGGRLAVSSVVGECHIGSLDCWGAVGVFHGDVSFLVGVCNLASLVGLEGCADWGTIFDENIGFAFVDAGKEIDEG
jgi:hypothetical protein